LKKKIADRLNKFLNNSTNKNYIQEFLISKRDDCYTIPVKTSYKNQVPGRVVEVSSTGSTVFIEPSGVSKFSAEFTTLKTEEEVEEYQILSTLAGIIMTHVHEIRINMELISQYDMLFAKGKFSRDIDGIEPCINDYGKIKLLGCKHPLLEGDVVPLDFSIGTDYRGLIITGPNAGGKTVVLKTVGLLTLAVMSGFHITADKETEVAVFENIFADIGDNQSMENALSTFSSHMKTMSLFLRKSNHNTLVLSDEIGSGTEPGEGAALAVSMLETLYKKGCMTVATTHYGEIKNFSEQHPDFMNAAMRFNPDTLEPLYQLMIGESGDSNALFIAEKMDVAPEILERAKRYIQNKDYDFSYLDDSKVRRPKEMATRDDNIQPFKKGDRVILLDYDDAGLVYEKADSFNNVTVFYQGEFLTIHEKRLQLELSREALYPEGYDLEQLFTDYDTRKMAYDLERGSKKALRKIDKEIRGKK
jgi:DNA mismatch repair protein MutS2